MSVKQQQAALEKALQNEQFLSKIRQLEADGDFKKADELKKLNAYYAQMGDEAAEGFQATVNGNLRNKAAQKLNFASQGEVLRSTQQVLEENKSAAQAFDSVAGRVAETEKTIGRTQAAFGTTADSNLKYTEQVNFAIAAQGEKREELEKKVNAEIEKQKKGADKITGNQGDMIKTQQEINAKLEEAVFKGIPNAQANMSKLANVTDTLANAFTTLTDGLNRLLKLVGLGEKEAPAAKQMTAAEIAAAGATAEARNTAKPMQDRVDKLAKELDADEKALKDAKRAGKYGAELKPLEDKILKNKEEYEKATKELIDAENQIKKSAQEEGKIRLKQMQDRKLLQRLENANLSDTEEIAKQNEKRADAIKAGKSTADIDKKISGLKTNIEGRSAQVTQLQADLKTSAVGGGAKPEEVLQFSGESGQRSNFDGLSEGMKTKLLAAGQQYFEQTGQKLQMNSGARDPEDQKRLYDETVQAGRPGIGPTGMPVAPPGKSSHETGNAVDIQNYSDPKAVAAMNAQGLRQTVPKDPVHFAIQAADGGVFSGPDSGYPAALHGEEAVIPLNNGGGNFVKIFEDMAMMMGKQVGAIDELIRIAKNSNDIQTKILRVQQ
jgi:LAS superfamily LD-carboxypeptidase LdcB